MKVDDEVAESGELRETKKRKVSSTKDSEDTQTGTAVGKDGNKGNKWLLCLFFSVIFDISKDTSIYFVKGERRKQPRQVKSPDTKVASRRAGRRWSPSLLVGLFSPIRPLSGKEQKYSNYCAFVIIFLFLFLDFKKLHEAHFSKMESIDSYVQRKTKQMDTYRSSVKELKVLLSCKKKKRTFENNSWVMTLF